ncbi:MAG: histidine phosphatase family protein [Pseudomonadota bacterium]
MAELYLLRHAQASFGTANYDRLSPLGCRQAEALGKFLRDCGVTFDAVYSGELQRQIKTATFALEAQPGGIDCQVDARFNEIETDKIFEHLVPHLAKSSPTLDALVKEGKTSSKAFQKALEIVFNHWVAADTDSTDYPSWAEYSGKVQTAIDEIIAREGSGKTVGIFTSGGTIATVVAYVLGASADQVYKYYEPLINCSITRLLYSGDKISLSSFNDHMFIRSLAETTGEPLLTYR